MHIAQLRTLLDTISGYASWARFELGSRLPVRHLRKSRASKHLALFAWAFPPHVSGGVYRPLSIVRYGSDAGWRVSVVARARHGPVSPAGEYLMRKLSCQQRIVCVEPDERVPGWRWFPRIDGGFLDALNAVRVARRQLADDPPDVVLASGPPFHMFVAAYHVARIFRARLALDYRDEWTECPFSFVLSGTADRRWEKTCLRRADRVIFTTESMRDHQLRVFPELRAEVCRVIPNGWEPEDFANGAADLQQSKGGPRIVISFIGTLDSHCFPAEFLATLARVLTRSSHLRSVVRLRFVGDKSEDAHRELKRFPFAHCLESMSTVAKPEAIALMRRSAALLIINDTTLSRYIPGKLYDYLAAGPPILAFGQGGETGRVITDLGAGLCVPPNDANVLENVLNQLTNGGVFTDRQRIEAWLADRSRKKLAHQIIGSLEDMRS